MTVTDEKKITDEPEWLINTRASAWKSYLNEPLPQRVSHLWRYTDPKYFELDNKYLTHKANPIVNLDSSLLNTGVVFQELTEAVKVERNQKIIKDKLKEINYSSSTRIQYLNDASWNSGFFLYVPAGIKIDVPLTSKISSFCDEAYSPIRGFIVLEENSSVSFIDDISSGENINLFTNYFLDIFLSRGSKLTYLNIQNHGKQATHHFIQRVVAEDSSSLLNLVVALGGRLSKFDSGVFLNGASSSVNTCGIVLGDGDQRFDHHTAIQHLAPFTKSNLNFRTALTERAHSAYTGNLKILKTAVKSDAYQENRNLLLSDKARAQSIPELEILTNDVVRCSHGVTVGQVDKEQIYYLTSRGLDQSEAENMIVLGFLEPTLSKIPDDRIKDEILLQIKKKLKHK